VIQCRTVRRLEESKQWDKNVLLEGGGTPWNLRKEGVVPPVADASEPCLCCPHRLL
jgi:hypothetical protein